MNNDHEVFKGKTFSDLLSDIYTNSKKKESQINGLIRDLQPMIKNLGDATIIVPLIAEYLDVGVKNDDHLIKMAAIVQRAMARTISEAKGGSILTEDEKKQLIAVAQAAEDKGEVNG
jgi:formaldehyde-activating enzyme involved in methanogenesis